MALGLHVGGLRLRQGEETRVNLWKMTFNHLRDRHVCFETLAAPETDQHACCDGQRDESK